jgi:hypothetical protein
LFLSVGLSDAITRFYGKVCSLYNAGVIFNRLPVANFALSNFPHQTVVKSEKAFCVSRVASVT